MEDRIMGTGTQLKRSLGLALVTVILAGPLQAAQPVTTDDQADQQRVSNTAGYLKSETDAAGASIRKEARHPALILGSRKTASEGRRVSGKSGAPSAIISQNINDDFWFYDAWVSLSYDQDWDGYYTDISLTFDADTYYSMADVFAVVYLSYQGGAWNEYAYTEDFTIFGELASDEYVIETTLASGYPTGDYDILIELYDAYTGYLVADMGPEYTQLSYLPLEDMILDTPRQAVVVSHGGGGAMGWLLLAMLPLAAVKKRGLLRS